MAGSTHHSPLSAIADIQSEITRALSLSASLNNPADHEVVAQYIAELTGTAAAAQADSGQSI